MSVTSDPEALLDGLTPEQRTAVTAEATRLLILAGAGSGKTRVLTRRIAWQAATDRADARRVLAVTFTRRAAGELRRRLADLGAGGLVTAATFHALAFAELRRRRRDRGQRPPQLLDRKGRVVAELLEGPERSLMPAVVTEIEWAQARLLDPEGYEALTPRDRPRAPLPPHRLASVYRAYSAEKRKRGLVDFDDLLAHLATELEMDPEFAAALQWRFRHVFVDEFQDVSPAQFRLLRAVLGARSHLSAVGDDDQAIYGFGGADARYVAEFREHFGDESEVVRLTANFRSSPQVVAAGRAALGRPAGDGDDRGVRHDGPAPRVTAYATDRAEAEGVARTASELQRSGVPWRAMAVLVRTNAQAPLFEEVMGAARIPVRVRGAGRFLDLAEVQAALHALAESERRAPGAGVAFHLSELEDAASRAEHGLLGRAPVATLLELGREYVAVEGDTGTVDGLRAFAATAMRLDNDAAPADAVDILTFHRAKGLEWPTVFVAGLEDGLVPIAHAEGPGGVAEERRLLHVAVTRAERHLFLSWAASRAFNGRASRRRPSPFLADIDTVAEQRIGSADGDAPASPVPIGGSPPFQELSERLRASPGADIGLPVRPTDPLYDALVAWRQRRAAAANVPEAAIAGDDVLRAITQARPHDPDTLREVAGLGEARLARYAPEILEVVAGYAER